MVSCSYNSIIITEVLQSSTATGMCFPCKKKFAEENKVEVFWIFTESGHGHGKGPMDGVGAAIKNSIDDAVVAAESMPNVSVRCAADVAPILNLVNVEICQYNASDVAEMKEKLPESKALSISCKKFGISKVHEIFIPKEQSNKILWKMRSEDRFVEEGQSSC